MLQLIPFFIAVSHTTICLFIFLGDCDKGHTCCCRKSPSMNGERVITVHQKKGFLIPVSENAYFYTYTHHFSTSPEPCEKIKSYCTTQTVSPLTLDSGFKPLIWQCLMHLYQIQAFCIS